MSEKNTHTFTSAFRQFLRDEKLDYKYREKLLVESWEIIMGKPIASRTTRLYIKDRTLFVYLSSAPLKQEMMNNRQRVKELIDEDFAGLVDEVRFL